MNNLDNSPWEAFSDLKTISNYNDKQLKEFTNQLLENNDIANAYFDIIIFIQTLKEIKTNIESKMPF